jgi:hypothetical protein
MLDMAFQLLTCFILTYDPMPTVGIHVPRDRQLEDPRESAVLFIGSTEAALPNSSSGVSGTGRPRIDKKFI